MTTNATTDTGAPATNTDAQLVDNATQQLPEGTATADALAEDDAILAAIRGEEAKPEAEATTDPVADAAAQQDPVADPKGGNTAEAAKELAKGEESILDAETPKDYKGRTREQFEKLKEQGRHHREEAQQLRQQMEAMQPNLEREANFTRLLAESGGTPEDIGTSISLIRAVNKGTPEEKQGALQIVEAIRGILADQLGVPVAGVDYLADQPDLKKRVDEGDLSPEDATELAVARRRTKVVGETQAQAAAREQQAAQQRDAQATEVQQRQQAAADVTAACNAYLARDGKPAYEARVSYAKQAFSDLLANGQVPPAKIAETFRRLYDSPTAKLIADAAVAGQRATVPGVRPVMGSRMGGNGAAQLEAQTEEDAVLQALRGG